MAIQEGKAAPAFSLTDAQGRKVALADLKGSDVILYFYPRDETRDVPRRPAASATSGARSRRSARW